MALDNRFNEALEKAAQIADNWAAENKDQAAKARAKGDPHNMALQLDGAATECNALATEIRKLKEIHVTYIPPCLICNTTLESAVPDNISGSSNQPMGATTFETRGHYGSTVFDPMTGSRLEINICDSCLTAAKERVIHYYPGSEIPASWTDQE